MFAIIHAKWCKIHIHTHSQHTFYVSLNETHSKFPHYAFLTWFFFFIFFLSNRKALTLTFNANFGSTHAKWAPINNKCYLCIKPLKKNTHTHWIGKNVSQTLDNTNGWNFVWNWQWWFLIDRPIDCTYVSVFIENKSHCLTFNDQTTNHHHNHQMKTLWTHAHRWCNHIRELIFSILFDKKKNNLTWILSRIKIINAVIYSFSSNLLKYRQFMIKNSIDLSIFIEQRQLNKKTIINELIDCQIYIQCEFYKGGLRIGQFICKFIKLDLFKYLF